MTDLRDEDECPRSTDEALRLVLQLSKETRDDVKNVIVGHARLDERVSGLIRDVTELKRRAPSRRVAMARDGGLVAGVGAVVAAVLQYLGSQHAPAPKAPTAAPQTAAAETHASENSTQ